MSLKDTSANTVRPPLWRAIVLGVLISMGSFYFGIYGYQITQAVSWGGTLQMGGVVTLFLVTVVIAAIGLLARRFQLQSSELLIIYIMTTITIAIGGGGMLGFLIPMLPAVRYYATPENGWESFLEHMPRWLTVDEPRVVEAFYEGSGTLYSLETLRAWAAPLGFWLAFALLLVLGTWALCNLVAQQWVDRERLNFPLARIPLAIVQAGEYRRFWCNRLVWVGFLIPVVLQSINYINYLHPSFPSLWLKARVVTGGLTQMPLAALHPVKVAFYPFMIGVVFLLSTDVSLSCWLFYWLSKLERVVGAMLGLGGGGGRGIMQLPMVNQQGTGALLTLTVVALWVMWRSQKGSLTNTRPEGVQVMSSQTSLIIIVFAFVGLIAMCSAAGLPVLIAAGYFLARWLMALGWGRVVSEAGAGETRQFSGTIQDMTLAAVGTQSLPPPGLAVVATFRWFNEYCEERAPQILGAYKLGQAGGIERKQLRTAFIVAIVVSIVWCAWTHLDIFYRHGAAMATTRQWYTFEGQGVWYRLQTWLEFPEGPDLWEIGGYLSGGAAALLLTKIRWASATWPLHPLGYALAFTNSTEFTWLPFLIGWLIKSTILRYGGFKVYRRVVPFFIGLIIGDLVTGGLWGLYGVIIGERMYMFFPH